MSFQYTLFHAAVCILLLTSCATIAPDPQLQKRANAVRLLAADQGATLDKNRYEIIREIVGVSCAKQVGVPPSADETRRMLRLKAAGLGADAVILGPCEPLNSTLMFDCWKAIECRGMAIKFTTQ